MTTGPIATTGAKAPGRLMGRAIAGLDRRRPWRVLDRPVFIITPPRSGSTLLKDLLSAQPELAPWPFEAHRAYAAAQPRDHPTELGHRWPAAYATEQLRRDLSRELYLGRLKGRIERGLPVRRLDRLALHKVRLLDKTPSTVLRVEVLAALYPDASFVFMHRDAPATIGSLLESWETPTGAHAWTVHEGQRVQWMMLAPPGWLDLLEAPYPVRSAFQWRAGVEAPYDALEQLASDRWIRLSYEDLLAEPERELRRVLEFLGLPADDSRLAGVERVGVAGRTSLTPPREGKWRSRAADIEPVLTDLAPVRARLGYR